MCLGLLALAAWGAVARGEVEPPMAPLDAPIVITADQASRWREGQYEVWLLGGDCQIQQDQVRARCRDAVLWIDRGDPSRGILSKIIAYLETDVWITFGRQGAVLEDRFWLGRFHTSSRVVVRAPLDLPAPKAEPPVVQRGMEARNWETRQDVRPAQFVPLQPAPAQQELLPNVSPEPSPTFHFGRINVYGRSGVRPTLETIPKPDSNETIGAFTSGVRITVSGIDNVPHVQSGTVILEADRIVFWTDYFSKMGGPDGATAPSDRWEFYLEGNIVFREGDRVIYADRMYYNTNNTQGVILNAEALTPVADYQGLIRLKADVLQQLNQQNFVAYGAAITSSRLGVPRYWIQSQNLTFQDLQQPDINPITGVVNLDPVTREAAVEHQYLATSHNNFLYIGGYPVLYWPLMATDLSKPTFYVDRIRINNDGVFGTQALIDWDMYQLLGIRNPPAESDWTISTDYLSERGFAAGTNFRYESADLFHLPGPYSGFVDAWGLNDRGRDNLGFTRRALIPEQEFRGRVLAQHRHRLPAGFQFSGELGISSERTFMEQFYGQEWDELKDQTTGLELKQYNANQSWSITADARLNDFLTQTEWLPRLDHFLLGQSVLFDRLTWYTHSHVGYANLEVADPPSPVNPAEVASFMLLPWEVQREGVHAATRHELGLPVQVGPTKWVPYVLGEVFHVGESISGTELTRTFGQAGVRASLPFWATNPAIRSPLFNLNGMAHKVVLDAELMWAEADEELTAYPLYESLDDDNIERFRRRMAAQAGSVPLVYDPRFFALRSGMQSWVTAPSTVVADDLTLLTLGMRQRWQTKRGLPGQERIVDWIVLDVEGSLFPKPDRDNFGEEFGLFNYDFRWHLGDRLTLLSDGFVDVFAGGLRTFTVGGVITRPQRGQLYVGFRTIEGPISTNILSGSLSYRMSDKWVLTSSSSLALDNDGNVGQSLALTRIGESALIRAGVTFDESRDNVGLIFAVEPRFLASSQLRRIGGAQIPPAGALGLE